MAIAAQEPPGYARRRPDETDLHRLLAARWRAFLDESEAASGLPRFVERTFASYLRCGLLEHGFVRVSCSRCRDDLLVVTSANVTGGGQRS